MGFTYDYYVDEDMFAPYAKANRDRLMLAGIYLDDDAIDRNEDILDLLPDDKMPAITANGLAKLGEERRRETCDTFVRDNEGFTATCNLSRENLVFFSVPYDDGWTATVNGEPVRIEKANVGFMAVRVPAGEATIRFDYETPSLKLGLLITAGAGGALLLYLLLVWLVRRKHPEWKAKPGVHLNREPAFGIIPAAEAYEQSVSRKIRAVLAAPKEEPGEEASEELESEEPAEPLEEEEE